MTACKNWHSKRGTCGRQATHTLLLGALPLCKRCVNHCESEINGQQLHSPMQPCHHCGQPAWIVGKDQEFWLCEDCAAALISEGVLLETMEKIRPDYYADVQIRTGDERAWEITRFRAHLLRDGAYAAWLADPERKTV